MPLRTKLVKIIEEPKAMWAYWKNFPNYKMGARLAHQAYEFLSALRFYGKPIKTFIDIGAFEGDYIECSLKFAPDAEIYAIEPTLASCEIIRRKIKNNPKVKLFQCGLWNKNDKATFYINPLSANNSFVKKEGDVETIVERKRFDSLGIKIKRPSFVKIDTEYSDLQVLQGFGKKLNKIDLIQVEFAGGEGYVEIIDLLKRHELIHFLQVGFRPQINKSDLIFKRSEKT